MQQKLAADQLQKGTSGKTEIIKSQIYDSTQTNIEKLANRTH